MQRNEMLYLGAGAGLGIIIPQVLKKYDGQIFQGPWGKYSTIIPLVTGGAGLAIYFLNLVKNENIGKALFAYGITSVISAAFNGLNLSTGYSAGNGGCSSCYGKATQAGWPYVSRAAGYGTPQPSSQVIVA